MSIGKETRPSGQPDKGDLMTALRKGIEVREQEREAPSLKFGEKVNGRGEIRRMADAMALPAKRDHQDPLIPGQVDLVNVLKAQVQSLQDQLADRTREINELHQLLWARAPEAGKRP